jgi:hypothetical protein
VLAADAARGDRHALAGQERDEERPAVGAGVMVRGEIGRLQVETPGRRNYAKLSSAGGVWCGLAEVLDSTLYDRCARPAGVTGNHKTPAQTPKCRPR